MEQTFNVEEWGAETTADIVAGFQIGGTDRYYDVELYKSLDTVAGYSGTFGDVRSLRRKIKAINANTITNDMYNKWYGYTFLTGEHKVTDKGYDNNPSFTFKTLSEILNDNGFSSETQKYITNTATNMGFKMTADIIENDDGYIYLRFYREYPFQYQAQYRGDIKDKGWRTGIEFPRTTSKQNGVQFDFGHEHTYNTWSLAYDSGTYAKVGVNDRLGIQLRADGSGGDDWRIGTSYAYYKIIDSRAPQQVGLANLAFGRYKAGDTISITVIYDEVIKSASGMGLSAISGLHVKDVQFAGGEGTNALTFTATLTADFEATPDFNNEIKALKPVVGTVYDVLGNHN